MNLFSNKLFWLSGIIIFFIIISILSGSEIQYYLDRAETYKTENKLNLAMGEYLKIIAREPKNIVAHRKLAELYVDMEYYESAIDEYNLILTLTNNANIKYQTYIHLGDLYTTLKKHDNAIKYYKEALNIDPKKYEIRYIIGKYYLSQEDFLTAFEYFHEIRMYYQKNINFLLDYGMVSFNLNDYTQAKAIYKRAYNIDKNIPIVSKRLGIIKYHEKDYFNSAVYLRHYVNLVSDDIEALKLLGEVYNNNQDYENAYKTYSKLTEIETTNFENFFLTGFYAFQLENYNEAEENLLKSLELNKNDERIYKYLYELYYINQNFDKSVNILKKYYDKFPANLNILVTLAEVKKEKGDYEKSVETYKQILQKNKSFRPALEGLTKLRFEFAKEFESKNDYQRAIEEYNKIIELLPANFPAYYELGKLYYKINNYQLALFFLEKGYELQKEDYDLNRLLGITYYNLNNQTRSAELLMKALEVEQNDIEVLRILSDIFYKQKDYKQAIKSFEQIVKIAPEARDFYNLGILYEAIEDYLSAISYYETALKLNDEWKSLYYKLGDLNYKTGRYNQALNFYVAGENYFQDDAELFYKIGEIYFINRNYKQSLNYLNTSKEKLYTGNNMHFILGIIHNQNKNFLDSIAELEKVYNSYPDYTYRDFNISKLLFAGYTGYSKSIIKTDIDTAEQYFQKALSIDNTNIEIYLYLAEIELNKNNFNRALGYLWIADNIEPKNIKIFSMLADAHFGRKSYREAAKLYEEYIQLDKKAESIFEIQYNLAYSYSQIGESKKSIDTYRSIFRLKESADARINIAKEYFKVKNYRNAEWHLNKLFEYSPKHKEALDLGIKICFETENYKKSLEYISRIKQLDVDINYYTFYEGLAYMNMEQHDKAAILFNALTDYKDKTDEINYYLGLSYYRLENWNEAEKYFNKSKKFKPEIVSPLLKDVYINLAEKENRLENLLQAYEIDSKDNTLIYMIANQYISIKDYSQAKKYLLIIDSEIENFKDVSKKIAEIYEIENDYQKAIFYYKKYNIKEKRFEVKNKIAFLSENLKDYDEAIKFYIRTFNINKNVELLLKIADLYLLKSDTDNAIKYLENYANINNTDESNIFKLAELLIDNNYNLKAAGYLNNLLSLNPNEEKYYYNLGIAYLNQKKYRESFNSFLKCNNYFKTDISIYKKLSEIIIALEIFDNQTETIYITGLNYFTNDNFLNYMSGLIIFNQNNYEESEKYFEAAGVNFDNTKDYLFSIYSKLSQTNYKKQNYAQAINYSNKILSLSNNDISALMTIANSLFSLNQYDESLKYLQSIDNIEKNRRDVLSLKANIYFIKKNFTNVEKYYSFLTLEELNQTQIYQFIYSLTELNKYNKAYGKLDYMKLDNYEKTVLAEKIYQFMNNTDNYILTLINKIDFVNNEELIKTIYNLVTAYFKQNNWKKVIQYGNEIYESKYISNEEKGFLAYYIGKSHIETNNNNQALKYYSDAIPPVKEFAKEIYLDYANLLNESKDYISAVDYYEKYFKFVQDTDIKNIIGILSENIADNYFKLNDYQNAEIYYLKAQDYTYNTNNITYKLAQILLLKQNYDKAVTLLKSIHTNESSYQNAEYFLYKTYRNKGDSAAAVKYFENFANRKNDKNYFLELADFFAELNEYEKGINYYKQYLDFHDNPNVRKKIGFLYYKTGQISEAYNNYTTYYNSNKEDYNILLERIKFLVQLNRLQEAENESVLYLKHRNDDPIIHIYISEINKLNSKYDKALQALEKAADKGYKNKDLALKNGELLYLKNDFSEAYNFLLKYYENNNASFPDEIYHYYFGDILFINEKYDEAIKHLSKVTNSDYKNEISYKIGYSYLKLDNSDNSLKFLVNIDESSSYYTEAIFTISKIYETKDDYENAYKYSSILSNIQPVKNNFERNADLNFKMNNYEIAENYYIKALSKESDYNIYKKLGNIYQISNAYDSSIIYYSDYYEQNKNDYEILDLIGELYITVSDTINAIKTFQESIAVNPAKYTNYKRLAVLWESIGNPVQVIHNYRKYLESETSETKIYKKIADEYLKIGRFERAIEYYDEYKKTNKLNAESYYNMGLAYRNTGNLEKATEYLNECLKLDKDFTLANNLFVAIYYEKGKKNYYDNKYEEALNNFSKAESIQTNYEDINLMTAKIFVSQNNYQKAKNHLDSFLTKEITNIQALETAYKIYSNLKLYDELESIFEKALTIGEKIENIRILAANFYFYIKKDYLNSIKMLEAINNNLIINDETLLHIFAHSYYMNEDYENALKYYNILNNLKNKSDNQVLLMLANSYFFSNNLNQAKNIFNDLLNKNYSNIIIYKQLGNIEYKSNNYNDAILYYLKYFNEDSNNYDVNYNLGFSYFRINDYKNAVKYFKNAANLTEDKNHTLYYLYGLSEYHIGNYENSLNNLLKAEEYGRNNLWSNFYIGRIYFTHKNNFHKSYDYFLKALSFDMDTNLKINILQDLIVSGYNINNYKEVVNFCDDLLELSNDNFIALFYKAKSLFKINNFIESKNTFNLIQQQEDNIDYYLFGGQLYNMTANYNLAIEFLNKALSLEINNIIILNELANSYYLLNNAEKAQEYLEKSLNVKKNFTGLKLYGLVKKNIEKRYNEALKYLYAAQEMINNSEINYLIAESLFESERLRDSIEFIKKTLNTNMDDDGIKVDFYILKFKQLIQLGFYEEVVNIYNKINISNNETLDYQYAMTHFYLKNFENCHNILEKYLNNTNNPDLLNLFALVQFNLNSVKDAIKYLEKAIALKNDIRYYLNLSKIYQYENDIPNAVKMYKNILSLDENNFDAHYNLGKILIGSDKDEAAFHLRKAMSLTDNQERITEMRYLLQN